MQKTLEKYRSKKKNGGFTLVELIIVIAIMAALVAILAPQYMQYVDKSRKAADQSTAEEIFTASKVAATDETLGNGFTVTWNGSTITFGGTDGNKAKTVILQNLGITAPASGDAVLVAKYTGTKSTSYTVTYTPASGNTGATVAQAGGWWS